MRNGKKVPTSHRKLLSLFIGPVLGILLLLSLLLGISQSSQVSAAASDVTISGNVFRDYDNNAADAGALEPGIQDVLVSVTTDSGILFTTTTDVNGDYSVLISASDVLTEVRVVFSTPVSLDFLESGASAVAADGTSERFMDVSPGGAFTVDVGFNNPAQYCQADPMIATTCFVNGDGEQASATNPSADLAALVLVPYSGHEGAGNANRQGNPAQLPTELATTADIGPSWGIAYDRHSQRIFTAALAKRHSGIGPGGYAAIYVTDISAGTPGTTALYMDLTNFGVTSAGTIINRDLTGDSRDHSRDPDAYNKVAKVSFGDLEISEDGNTLYTVNLAERTLVEIDISNFATPVVTRQIPISGKDSTCTNGLFRPWALEISDAQLYVGGVCSGENGGDVDDLTAAVYRVDLTAGALETNPVYSRSLNYRRGRINGSAQAPNFWEAWSPDDTWTNILSGTNEQIVYPEPILSDIEFDIDGSMILGLMDRHGHMVGHNNLQLDVNDPDLYSGIIAGDLLRACFVNGQFFDEGTANCPFNAIEGVTAATGQGSEYYTGLEFNAHRETFVGGLALLHGSGEVVASAMDPFAVNSGGLYWLNNTTGESGSDRYELYAVGQTNPTYLGKANGLGDLELLCAPAPLEIGNRVWEDVDGDGVQDPGETPIANVPITLYEYDPVTMTYTAVATIFTNSEGHFLFNDSNVPGGVKPDTTYVLRIDDVTAIDNHFGTDDWEVTADSQGVDTLDNDSREGLIAGTDPRPEIQVTTGGAGQNDHTLDFGFLPIPSSVTLSNFEVSSNSNSTLMLIFLGIIVIGLTGVMIGFNNRKPTG